MTTSRAPVVRLGATHPDGVAPILLAVARAGVAARPSLVEGLEGEVELRLAEGWPAVRIRFDAGVVTVFDAGFVGRADAVVEAGTAQLAALLVAPARRGVPLPTSASGRRALAHLTARRVRIERDRGLARRLLEVLAVEVA